MLFCNSNKNVNDLMVTFYLSWTLIPIIYLFHFTNTITDELAFTLYGMADLLAKNVFLFQIYQHVRNKNKKDNIIHFHTPILCMYRNYVNKINTFLEKTNKIYVLTIRNHDVEEMARIMNYKLIILDDNREQFEIILQKCKKTNCHFYYIDNSKSIEDSFTIKNYNAV